MEHKVRLPVLSFLIAAVMLLVNVGANLGAPDTSLHAANDPTAVGGQSVPFVRGGPTNTPTTTATACPGGPFDILIVYTDDSPTLLLRGELLAQPNVASVALFDAYVDTPTLAELQPYDLVVAMGNLDYDDPETLGDNLADYHDGGGVVVPVFGSFFDIEAYAIRGRWDTGGYSPYTYGSSVIATSVTLGGYDPTHPLMQEVDALNAIARVVLTPAPGATEVAEYSDGTSAAAYKTTGTQTSVGLSAYLGDSFNRGTGDYARVIVNAAEWLLDGECPTVLRLATMERAGSSPTDTPLLILGFLGVLTGLSIFRYRRQSR